MHFKSGWGDAVCKTTIHYIAFLPEIVDPLTLHTDMQVNHSLGRKQKFNYNLYICIYFRIFITEPYEILNEFIVMETVVMDK